MSVTILEALQNADYNFQNGAKSIPAIAEVAKRQLHNAVSLLEKGYSLEDEVEPLLEEYGDINLVPDKN